MKFRRPEDWIGMLGGAPGLAKVDTADFWKLDHLMFQSVMAPGKCQRISRRSDRERESALRLFFNLSFLPAAAGKKKGPPARKRVSSLLDGPCVSFSGNPQLYLKFKSPSPQSMNYRRTIQAEGSESAALAGTRPGHLRKKSDSLPTTFMLLAGCNEMGFHAWVSDPAREKNSRRTLPIPPRATTLQ
ncbi:hypothetical protein AVEN_55694-1 [Araneus ventricosus]|uniref:Uncharacterized protein n=1 Tax=Araneus ventricosus TaxID=182803 RepID=A0A4Y2UT95_ARAVE|nr:hypothetical protein AVEN_55694-1 [Araneus ventricosus]